VRVRVDVAAPETGVTVPLLQEPVTPAGSPERLSVTGPLKEPPVVIVNRSVAVAPCKMGTFVKAPAMLKVGLAKLTLVTKPWLAVYCVPLPASVNETATVRVPLLATAAALPVRVRVQFATLAELTVGWLQEAVMPVGRPETMVALADAGPATVKPPSGVAEIAIAVVPVDVIPTVHVGTAICTPRPFWIMSV